MQKCYHKSKNIQELYNLFNRKPLFNSQVPYPIQANDTFPVESSDELFSTSNADQNIADNRFVNSFSQPPLSSPRKSNTSFASGKENTKLKRYTL